MCIFELIVISLFFRLTFGSNSSNLRGGRSIYKKYCMLGIIIIFGVIVFFLIMSRLGRYSTENDPNFDINNNPNIHVKRIPGLD